MGLNNIVMDVNIVVVVPYVLKPVLFYFMITKKDLSSLYIRNISRAILGTNRKFF